MRRNNMGHRNSIGNNPGGPLMTGHLKDIDLELELLKRKREMIEQQQQLLVMEQQFKSSRHYDSYDQPRYNEPEQHGSNRDFTHLYDSGPKHRNQVGRKRQAEVQWQYEGSSKRTQQKRKSNQSQFTQYGQGKARPSNFRNPRPFSGPNQGSKSSPKGPAPLMDIKIKPSIGQKIANQKPSPKGVKDSTLSKSFKPKASQAPNKLASQPLADRRSLVSAANKSVSGADVSRMLLPDRVPTQQVSGRLELALGAIMKNIRSLVPNESPHATMLRSAQLQRVMKQVIRERIRTVMLGKVVGSLLDILAIYREEFPEETDMDIVNIALEAGGVPAQERQEKTKLIESEDPGKFFKLNMSYLIETKLNEMFDKLQEIYGHPLPVGASTSGAINSETTTSGATNTEATNVETVDSETTNVETADSEATNVGTADSEATNSEATNIENAKSEAANIENAKSEAANIENAKSEAANIEAVSSEAANGETANSEPTNSETGAKDGKAAQSEATGSDVTNTGAPNTGAAENGTSNAVSGDQAEPQKYDKNRKRVEREDSEEFKNFLNTDIKVRDIRRFLPRLMKKYVPYMIKLMNLDVMYQTTKAAVTMKANQKAANIFNNKAPGVSSEKTVAASENSTEPRHAYNLPYYVKIMGRPTLPKRKVMQAFLNQFNPKSIKKHRTIHNLLFVGFTEKSDFDTMVGADGTVIGRSTLSVRICSKGTENNAGKNDENNDSSFAMDVSQDSVKKEGSKDEEIITADLDNQITNLLSAIRKSEEADSTERAEKTGEETDDKSFEVKTEPVAEESQEQNKSDAENPDNQAAAEKEAVDATGETPADVNMDGSNEVSAENAQPSNGTDKSEATDAKETENSEDASSKHSTSDKTNTGEEPSNVNDKKTEEQSEEDKVAELKGNASGRSTPSRTSARLASVTPSTIRTRRASRLAQN